jgi:diacylglycerol O-acyltransferase / wax synthase
MSACICVTYDGSLNIGFTGCRDSVPHLQRIAVYVAVLGSTI